MNPKIGDLIQDPSSYLSIYDDISLLGLCHRAFIDQSIDAGILQCDLPELFQVHAFFLSQFSEEHSCGYVSQFDFLGQVGGIGGLAGSMVSADCYDHFTPDWTRGQGAVFQKIDIGGIMNRRRVWLRTGSVSLVSRLYLLACS